MKSLTMIIITNSIVIFTFTDFLVPLFFVLFVSLHVLICYYFLFSLCYDAIVSLMLLLPLSSLSLSLSYLFFIVVAFLLLLLLLFCFLFFGYFFLFTWLNNSFSHMNGLSLIDYFVWLVVVVCSFVFDSWAETVG